MGLDMYLFHVPKQAEPEMGPFPPLESIDWNEVESRADYSARNELLYWRKENAIHQFFVEHCAGGVDNCQPVKVHPEVLADLYQRCRQVLADHSLAKELLPTQGGFFFGSTDYDEWYFDGLRYTVEALDENVMRNPSIRGHDIYYQASW